MSCAVIGTSANAIVSKILASATAITTAIAVAVRSNRILTNAVIMNMTFAIYTTIEKTAAMNFCDDDCELR